MFRVACGLVLIGLASVAQSASTCERTPLDAYVESGRDLLIGEVAHGVVETPELVRCLVLTALARTGGEPLVVSLEFTPAARDLSGAAWKSADGRSSIPGSTFHRFGTKVPVTGPLVYSSRPSQSPENTKIPDARTLRGR